MKTFGIVLLSLLATSCFAQNSTTSLLGIFSRPIDVTTCYHPTPAIVLHAQPEQILFQSTDGGTTWIDLSKGLPEHTEPSNAFVKGTELYIGTRDGKLYYTPDPQTTPWELQQLDEKQPSGFITGIYDGNSGTYACLWQEGFYRQIPGTNNWKPMHTNLEDKNIHAVLETPDGTLLVGCPSGIYQSKDDGKTWKHIYSQGWVNNLTYQSNTILANSSQGILRSVNGGEHWNCVFSDVGATFNISVIDGYFVVIRIAGPWRSATEHIQFISVSSDGGNTWQNMDAGKPADTHVYDLEKMGEHLFSSREAGISRSNDMGKSWQLLLAPPAGDDPMQFEMIVSKSSIFVIVKRGGC